MVKKILPARLQQTDFISNDLDPNKIIVWCPFWHDLKIFSKNVERIDQNELSKRIDQIVNNWELHTKEDLINMFNLEKELRHNTYFPIFKKLCDVVSPEYIIKLQWLTTINKDFFVRILNQDVEQLNQKVIDELVDEVKTNADKFKDIDQSNNNFKLIQDFWYRKLWNGRWIDLYESAIIWFDQLIHAMRMYFYYIVNHTKSYKVWENQKKLNIPKHFYFWVRVSQFHSYIINNIVLRDIIWNNPFEIIYDENTVTWYSLKVENLLKEKIKETPYSDFYNQELNKFNDLSNLVMPLEENYPCPAIWFFPQMWAICLWIMIEKYWIENDFNYQ